MPKSQRLAITGAIRQISSLADANRIAGAVVKASRLANKDEARTLMNIALANTPFCAWFTYHKGPYIGGYNYGERRAIQIRFGADVITEFPI